MDKEDVPPTPAEEPEVPRRPDFSGIEGLAPLEFQIDPPVFGYPRVLGGLPSAMTNMFASTRPAGQSGARKSSPDPDSKLAVNAPRNKKPGVKARPCSLTSKVFGLE